MIKFLGKDGDRPMLGFGLSRGNCRKLLEGKPIYIDLKVMMMDIEQVPDLREATVLIFGGEDEQQMERELSKITTLPKHRRKHYEEN